MAMYTSKDELRFEIRTLLRHIQRTAEQMTENVSPNQCADLSCDVAYLGGLVGRLKGLEENSECRIR